jgi:hypothetical protein
LKINLRHYNAVLANELEMEKALGHLKVSCCPKP